MKTFRDIVSSSFFPLPLLSSYSSSSPIPLLSLPYSPSPRYCLALPFESEELTAKLLQYFLRCLEKKKDADAGLRIELEKSLRRLLAFVFVRDKAAELIPWKEFVKTKNVVTGVVIPMVKVRKL